VRFLIGSLCILMLCGSGIAQPQHGPTRLTIHPAPAPEPALRYRLFPSEMDRTLGNAALTYYRCLSPEWFTLRNRPELANKVEEALKAPLKDVERKEVSWVLQTKQLEELDRAARQEQCDWEFLARVRRDGIELLLPDIQSFRSLGSCQAVRAKLLLADAKFDPCVYSLQTLFSLGYDLAKAPIAINALVGIAVARMALDQVREFVQQPGAPNLYWALATIPRPFVDWPKIIEAEQASLYAAVPLLRDIEKRRLGPEEYAELQRQLARLIDLAGPRYGSEGNLGLTFLVLKQYPQAREALIAQGRKAEDVDAMPALRVCIIYSLQQFRRLQDEEIKWLYLPDDLVGAGPDAAERQISDAREKFQGEPFNVFLSAPGRLRGASLKIERQIALLQVVEAIRLHAAEHGSLPPTLDAIKAVPVPHDPATGKDFGYKIEGERAILSIPSFQFGERQDYELTLSK